MSLSDFRGKTTLLAFWFPGCAPCRAELPHLETLYRKYSRFGFEVVALDITGDLAAGQKYAQANNLSYTFLNADGDVAGEYGIQATPTLVLLNSENQVAARYVGNHNGLEKRLQELMPEAGQVSSLLPHPEAFVGR